MSSPQSSNGNGHDETHGGRQRLPVDRESITHRFTVGESKGYVTVGFYPDGRPGEVFFRMAKTGSTISGLLDTLAIAVSIGLQHGIPLAAFVDKFTRTRFEPDGFSGPEFKFATSIVDYLFRWMGARFCGLPEHGNETNMLAGK